MASHLWQSAELCLHFLPCLVVWKTAISELSSTVFHQSRDAVTHCLISNVLKTGYCYDTGYLIYEAFHVCMLSCFSHVLLFVTLWTVAWQASLTMGFSRQEYYNELSCSPSQDLHDAGIQPISHVSYIVKLVAFHIGLKINFSPVTWYCLEVEVSWICICFE